MKGGMSAFGGGGGILNIVKNKMGDKDPDEERQLLPSWTAQVDLDVSCTCCAFSPSADMLAVGDDMGAVSIVAPKTGEVTARLGAVHNKQTTNMAMSLADNGRGTVMAVKFNPGASKKIIRIALSNGKVEQWDASPGKNSCKSEDVREDGQNKDRKGCQQALALDYVHDGQYFAVAGVDHKDGPGSQRHAVRVYDEATSKLTMTLIGDMNDGHSNRVSCLRFDQKAKGRLASGSMDGTVKLWSTGDRNPIATLPGGEKDAKGQDPQGKFDPTSVDFVGGNYLLISSARPLKNLTLYDLRMATQPVYVSDVRTGSREPAPDLPPKPRAVRTF